MEDYSIFTFEWGCIPTCQDEVSVAEVLWYPQTFSTDLVCYKSRLFTYIHPFLTFQLCSDWLDFSGRDLILEYDTRVNPWECIMIHWGMLNKTWQFDPWGFRVCHCKGLVIPLRYLDVWFPVRLTVKIWRFCNIWSHLHIKPVKPLGNCPYFVCAGLLGIWL